MNRVMKAIVVGTVPAVMGLGALPRAGIAENVAWPQVEVSEPPVPPNAVAGVWPPVPAPVQVPEEPPVMMLPGGHEGIFIFGFRE